MKNSSLEFQKVLEYITWFNPKIPILSTTLIEIVILIIIKRLKIKMKFQKF
jgi:hypothetical protein